MKIQNTTKNTLVLVLAALSSIPAVATPDTVVWSARVESGAGPVNGTVSLSLALYDAASGGSVVHTETEPSAMVQNGELVHELGASAANPLDDEVLGQDALFLEVVINGETLSPRLPIRAVPYALRAEQCSSLEGLSAADVATDAEVSAAIQENAVTASPGRGLEITNNQVGISDNSITGLMLAGGAVTSNKLAANAVMAFNILDGAVSTAKITNNAVTGAKIADGTVRDADVTGISVYEQAAGCSMGHQLVLGATCSTPQCDQVPVKFSTCSGACNASSSQTCTNTYLGKLVK